MMIDEVDMNYTIAAPTRPKAGDYKSGSLERITVKEITQILEITIKIRFHFRDEAV